MIFSTKVNGIPCQCEVTHYTPYVPMHVYGSGMGDADAPQESEFEYQILDRRGKPAAWLERYINDRTEQELYEEFQMAMTAERLGIDY